MFASHSISTSAVIFRYVSSLFIVVSFFSYLWTPYPFLHPSANSYRPSKRPKAAKLGADPKAVRPDEKYTNQELIEHFKDRLSFFIIF